MVSYCHLGISPISLGQLMVQLSNSRMCWYNKKVLYHIGIILWLCEHWCPWILRGPCNVLSSMMVKTLFIHSWLCGWIWTNTTILFFLSQPSLLKVCSELNDTFLKAIKCPVLVVLYVGVYLHSSRPTVEPLYNRHLWGPTFRLL